MQDFALAPEAAGYRVEIFDTVGSTNAEALARGRAGDSGPLWVVARHQSAGRGRRGRAWDSPRGNLFASLLIGVRAEPAQIATLGFVAGLALVRALALCCPDDFALKWPNDVLARGAKLAGILLETEQRSGDLRIVAVGIGVNVAASAAGLPYRATSLAELGHATTAPELFHALSAEWVAALALWDEGRGFPAIRDLWLSDAAGLGRDIVVKLDEEPVRGTFESLDAGGQLVLRLADGSSRRVSAGDVHFGVAATVRSGAVG